MAFTKLTKDMNIIQKLDDEPNDVGGLTAAQLKAKFDEPANAVKDWINNTFIPEAEETLRDARLESLPAHAHLHAADGDDPITPAQIGAVAHSEKPSGYYTGNGSTAQRSVNIGGTGGLCLIYDSTGFSMAICSPAGAIYKNSIEGIIGFLENSVIRYENGVLTMATAVSAVNYNGGAYYYQVL